MKNSKMRNSGRFFFYPQNESDGKRAQLFLANHEMNEIKFVVEPSTMKKR